MTGHGVTPTCLIMIVNRKSGVLFFVKRCIVILFILFTGINVTAQQLLLKFSYLTVDNGLSHMAVHGVIQDRHGFIWVATMFGLDRYDGYTVKRFYNTNVPRRNAFNNRIYGICLDEHNRIWLCSEDGIQVFDPETEKYTDVTNVPSAGNRDYDRIFVLNGDLLAVLKGNHPQLFTVKGKLLTVISLRYPQHVSFTDMAADHSGNIYLSSNDGFWLLDHSLHFRHFEFKGSPGEASLYLNHVFVNRTGQPMLTTGSTIVLIKEQTSDLLSARDIALNPLQRITIPDCKQIRDIIQDKHLNYWISTDAGLFLLDRAFKLKQAVKKGSTANSLNTNNLGGLLIDRSECLWISTPENGVNSCDLNAKPFYLLQHSADMNSLSGNFISNVLEESGRKVWIGTNDGGLNAFDLQTLHIKHYTTKSAPLELSNDNIRALALDNDQNLWIGTDRGVQILNKKRNALWQPAGHTQFPSHYISTLAKDYYGHIWFGNYNEMGSIIRGKNNVYQVKPTGGISGHQIWANSKKPELLVSTTAGLLRLIIDSAGGVTKIYRYKAGNSSNSLSSDFIYPVRQQNDTTYWIGTIGGGLDRLLLKKDGMCRVTNYGSRDGIFNDVESVEFDHNGNIWMGGVGENGLECFNPQNKNLNRYDKNDGLQGNSFKIGASGAGKDGRLYFGGINGLNYFFPDSIKSNPIPARPVFTDLLINNKKVFISATRINTGESVIGKSIAYSQALHLDYLQNNFVISFSAMHFANSQKCQYRYKLVGFDKEWRSTDGSSPSAAYNNLDYDDYSLIVEATNNDGVWSKDKAIISITIAPPWWKSTISKTINLILFISGLLGIYIYQARWFRLKRELLIRQLEEKRQEERYHQQLELNQRQLKLNDQIQEKNNVLQEADQFKNKLVSILAHDFRSPLSSTITMARLMQDNHGFKEEELERFYNSIENEATKMLESFDIILQWIRQQLSGYEFKSQTLALHDLFRESVTLFQSQLETKRIIFCNQIPEDIFLTSDKEMLQFVNRNLLSNAIKFSPEGGTITVRCIQNVAEFIVNVSDDGPGMSETTLSKLFSISNQDRHSTQMGAGIALSLCKDFINKLNGRIWAENKKPNGAVVYYTLPAK